MRMVRASCVAVLGLSALGTSLISTLASSDPVQAQVRPGEYVLLQDGCVGWVCASADGRHEYWAYVEGDYEWAGSWSTKDAPWRLEAQYLGAPCYQSFADWKDAVLARPEARGRTITFQDHSVAEVVVKN